MYGPRDAYGVCKADRFGGINYGKPHVGVLGKFNGQPMYSCLYCGRWLEGVYGPRSGAMCCMKSEREENDRSTR